MIQAGIWRPETLKFTSSV